MKDFSKLYRASGKRLNRLEKIIYELRPDLEMRDRIREWKSISNNPERASRISSFLIIKGFTDDEKEEITRQLYKLIIPWKRIGILLLLAGFGYLGFQYYHFTRTPLVYTFGNDVFVYSLPDTSSIRISQMDIFGQKFTPGSNEHERSYSKMLMADSSGSFTGVKQNNFITWLINKKPEGFVKNEELLYNKSEYKLYTDIFIAIKGDKSLRNLDMNARKVIHELVSDDATLKNAVLADDYPKDLNKAGFSKILPTGRLADGYSYIFMRLKTATGEFKNTLMRFDLNNKIEHFELSLLGKPQKLTQPGLFSQKPAGLSPDISFYDLRNKTEMKAKLPPYYDQFE